MQGSSGKIITVITGDLVGSRHIADRAAVSVMIESVIERINKTFKEDLAIPLDLTRGIDEFAAVLKSNANAFRICRMLNEELFPYTARLVISQGQIDIGIDSTNTSEMDGPVFHRASELMEWAKREDRIFGIWLNGLSLQTNTILTSLSNLIAVLMKDRSRKQNDIAKLYREYGYQKRVADELGITQQAVSHALKGAKWKETEYAEKALNDFFVSYDLKEIE